MANRSLVLDSGNVAILRALGDKVQIPIARFRVGSAFDFDPQKSLINPVGTKVEEAGIGSIGLDLIDNDKLRITARFNESMGNYDIGNIIFDVLIDGEYVPFIIWVSDIPITKLKYDSVLGTIGNSLNISFTETIQNIDEAVDITVLPVVFGSLPQYPTEKALPAPSAILFQNFTLQNYTGLDRPVIGARRSVDDTFFGFPLLERIDNPFFGVRDGGITGTKKAPFTGRWIWGGYLNAGNSQFKGTISGGSLADKDSAFGKTIRGEPLSAGLA